MCWKPQCPFSNVHFRNTTKILQHKFFTLKLLFIFTLSLLKVSFPPTMSLSCIFVFAPSFIHMDLSIMSTSTSLTFSGFLVLFYHISTLSTHRKSFCTFICQVSPLTSSCKFSMFPQCSLLPQASLMFI